MSEVPNFGKEAFDHLLSADPEVAEAAAEMRRLTEEDPRAVETVLHRLEDEAIMADPRVQESIRQSEAGEVTEITDGDLEEIESRA